MYPRFFIIIVCFFIGITSSESTNLVGTVNSTIVRKSPEECEPPRVTDMVLEELTKKGRVCVKVALVEPETADVDTRMTEIRRMLDDLTSNLPREDVKISSRFEYISGFGGTITERGLEALLKDQRVLQVSFSSPLRRALDESLPIVKVPQVHDQGFRGTGVTVAVIDASGLSSDDLAFCESVIDEVCIGNCPTGCSSREPAFGCARPYHSHGRKVTDVLLGTAPSVKILPVRIGLCEEHMLAAVEWVCLARSDVRVISMSMYTEILYKPPCNRCRGGDLCWDRVIELCEQSGIVFVASSGNSNSSNRLGRPACDSRVLSVGATYDEAFGSVEHPNYGCTTDPVPSPDTVACYSNRGRCKPKCVDGDEKFEALPYVLAPGGYITGRNDEGYGHGTSLSTPIVAGIAALLLERNPDLTPRQVRSILRRTGKPVYDDDPRIELFFPRVDADAAFSDPLVQQGGFVKSAGSGDWFAAGTWEDQGGFPKIPGFFDRVRIRSGHEVVVYPGEKPEVRSLHIEAGAQLHGDSHLSGTTIPSVDVATEGDIDIEGEVRTADGVGVGMQGGTIFLNAGSHIRVTKTGQIQAGANDQWDYTNPPSDRPEGSVHLVGARTMLVNGWVLTSWGKDAEPATGYGDVVGYVGGGGGKISFSGTVTRISCHGIVSAGSGGNGSDITAYDNGSGASGQDPTAGGGGGVEVHGRELVLLSKMWAGDGGKGGNVEAYGDTTVSYPLCLSSDRGSAYAIAGKGGWSGGIGLDVDRISGNGQGVWHPGNAGDNGNALAVGGDAGGTIFDRGCNGGMAFAFHLGTRHSQGFFINREPSVSTLPDFIKIRDRSDSPEIRHGNGGDAEAYGGDGATGLDETACGLVDRRPAGWGGSADACGGSGGSELGSMDLPDWLKGDAIVIGGRGGDAIAVGGRAGSSSGSGHTCPCTESYASSGANGTGGGSAFAGGGMGGFGDDICGDGGNATATCGNGSNGGNGGSCLGGTGPCYPGLGGSKGDKGGCDAEPGTRSSFCGPAQTGGSDGSSTTHGCSDGRSGSDGTDGCS